MEYKFTSKPVSITGRFFCSKFKIIDMSLRYAYPAVDKSFKIIWG